MKIYWILFYERPKVLAELDSYQRKHFGMGKTTEQEEPPVHFDYQGVGEDYEGEMAKTPSRSRE